MKKIISYSFIALIMLISCTKEEITPRVYPRVITMEAFNIAGESATFQGEITFSNVQIKDHGFVWADNIGPLVGTANTSSLGPASSPGVFQLPCTCSFQKGKKYYLRAYAISDDFEVYGNTVEFVGGK